MFVCQHHHYQFSVLFLLDPLLNLFSSFPCCLLCFSRSRVAQFAQLLKTSVFKHLIFVMLSSLLHETHEHLCPFLRCLRISSNVKTTLGENLRESNNFIHWDADQWANCGQCSCGYVSDIFWQKQVSWRMFTILAVLFEYCSIFGDIWERGIDVHEFHAEEKKAWQKSDAWTLKFSTTVQIGQLCF